MNLETDIQIIEKPDWVTWEEIKQCLMDAHATNRAKGINMTHYQWPAEKIEALLGGNGIMLVALDGDKLIGTAAIADKIGKRWYAIGHYAYICFDGIIPKYTGKGIFKLLDSERERVAQQLGYNILLFDTHAKNMHRQKIALRKGYRYVRFFLANSKDHYSVVMVKWLNGCPYSRFYCCWRYLLSKVKTILRTKFFRC